MLESGQAVEENPKLILEDQSDGQLVRIWKSGNERAAHVLIDRYAVRLVALAAVRFNRKLRSGEAPEDIVQSALGSFFRAVSHSRLAVSQSASLWQLLAVFVRRKLARKIERQSAKKRGAEYQHVENDWEQWLQQEPDGEVSELLEGLSPEHQEVCELLLAGYTQKEAAVELQVDERTIRRRLTRLRDAILEPEQKSEQEQADQPPIDDSLPKIAYREFVLGKLIGSGGFGKVYRAMLGSEQLVAVKFLRKAFWQDPVAKQSFLAELRSAATIRSPHVLRYLGWGESPHGGPYVISEWIEGKPLSKVHNASPKQQFHYLLQICLSLKDVHRSGVVHGDITPANVMVRTNDSVVLTDFGFARQSCSTISTPLGGTLGFAAPEQLHSSFGRITEATDVFAVGAIAYFFLTGKAPSEARGIQETFLKSIDVQSLPTQPMGKQSEYQQIFWGIAKTALQRSPAERPSISKLLARLKQKMATQERCIAYEK